MTSHSLPAEGYSCASLVLSSGAGVFIDEGRRVSWDSFAEEGGVVSVAIVIGIQKSPLKCWIEL